MVPLCQGIDMKINPYHSASLRGLLLLFCVMQNISMARAGEGLLTDSRWRRLENSKK